MRSEFELIEVLKKAIPKRLQGKIPIGDDAGGIRLKGSGELLVSTDSIVEGVDFRMDELGPEWVGRKALAVNLSDMAAMGARPAGFVAAVGIPAGTSEAWIRKFHRGMMCHARAHQVPCLGGDISCAKQFFATVTILGETKISRAVLRSGARVGDRIGVTGSLGGSILRHHYCFEPRVKEGIFLSEHFRPHAMIDLSDGLAQDLGHVLRLSKAGARIDLDRVPVSRDSETVSKKDGIGSLEHALSDGEDFELLFTVSPVQCNDLEKIWKRRFPRVKLSWIGHITEETGKIRWFENGRQVPAPRLKQAGYRHF